LRKYEKSGKKEGSKKSLKKSFLKKVEKITNCWRGGWRIVIPMPEALNTVEGRRQKQKKSIRIGVQSCPHHNEHDIMCKILILGSLSLVHGRQPLLNNV
jgi:hypothetical protein